MNWQPIETAPKSGAFNSGTILLFGPDMGIGIGWFDTDGREWINDCFPDHCNECEPTHWMPLPERP